VIRWNFNFYVMKVFFLLAPIFALLSFAYPCDNLRDIEDWTTDGDCFVTYAMSGPVFQFSRVDRAPINIRANTQGVYLWEEGKKDHSCQLSDAIDVKEHLQTFIEEVAKKLKNPRLARALSQLSEVVESGRKGEYDGMVFILTLREQFDSALARNSELSNKEEKLLRFILKENLSYEDRVVLVEIAKDEGVELFQSYWATLILAKHFPSLESEKLLKATKERVISAYVDQKPKMQLRGGIEKKEEE